MPLAPPSTATIMSASMEVEGAQNDIAIAAPADVNTKPPLSCAECRRLKVKCNRVWPCLSCQKRGLSELCPSGSLSTRPRQKPPPPTPQHVLERMHGLQGRVNELEAALAALQATVSNEPHPLLKNDNQPYLQRKLMRKAALEKAQEQSIDNFDTYTQRDSSPGEGYGDTDHVVASLGTLKIAPDGRPTFFGPSAVSEGLSIEQEPSLAASPPSVPKTLPIDIVTVSQSFPFATASDAVKALHERARSHLPPIGRAESLCASFFTYASFVFNIVPEDEWFETLFCRLYGTRRSCRRSNSNSPSQEDELATGQQWHLISAEELSLFFGILGLGALTDLSKEPFSAETEIYYYISRALLTTQNTLTEPTLTSIQALSLVSYYEGLGSQSNSSRDCWIMLVLANKTAQIMGLHRDHSMFGLDERDIQRRRLIFWETHSMGLIESLALGRPISISADHMDTRMPVDTEAVINPMGDPEESFHQWKYRFCAEVLTMVSEHVLRVRSPSYSQTLEVDRRMRRFTTSFARGYLKSRHCPSPTVAAQIQMMLGTKETCMLYIHRGFFAHAVSTESAQPEQSKYGRSVLAAYESACIIVQGMQDFVGLHAKFAARIWFLWNHLVSASFVLGSIVIRAPGCSLAATSLAQLDFVGQVFKQAAVYGGRAEYMMPAIERLRIKGHSARLDYQAGTMVRSPSSLGYRSEDNDELAVIGGKTRVVHSKQSSASPPAQLSPARDTNSMSLPHKPLQHIHPLDRMHEPYDGAYSALPLRPPSHKIEGNDGSYWSDVGFMRSQFPADVPGSGLPYFDQRRDPSHMPFPHLSEGLEDYPMYAAHTAGNDGSSSLWQTLVQDLGVQGP